MPKNKKPAKNNLKSFNLKKFILRLANTPLPELAFISAFVLSRWWLNSDFSYPVEVIIPIIMFGLLGTAAYYLFRKLLKDELAAHVSAILFSFGLYGYSFSASTILGSHIIKLLPSAMSSEFNKSIWLAIWFAAAAYGIGRLLRHLVKKYEFVRNLQLYKVLLFAIVFMLGLQLLRFGDRIADMWDELSYKAPKTSIGSPVSSVKGKPDIYYLLFDRYTNADVLKNNFNYDNSDLMNFLTSNDFVNRPQAYSNYPFTMSSVSSTLSMDYLTQFRQFNQKGWQATFPYRSIFNNPPVAQALKQNGYSYNQVSSWWDFTRLRVKSDTSPTKSFRLNIFGMSFYLSDLQRDILNKSIFSPWLKKGVAVGNFKVLKYDLDRNPKENFEAQISAVRDIASRPDKSKPNFTFAHILAPHPAYVFNKDGSDPNYDPEANDNDIDESVKYTNEVSYINNRIKDTISYIKQKSPGAVIVLQADEGPYPKQFRGDITPTNYYDPAKLSDSLIKQKFGVLASYYMPGVSKQDVGKINTSANAFRAVLNDYLGYNLPLLPDCHFSMGNKFSIYNYQEVTPRLKGQPAPDDCSKY